MEMNRSVVDHIVQTSIRLDEARKILRNAENQLAGAIHNLDEAKKRFKELEWDHEVAVNSMTKASDLV